MARRSRARGYSSAAWRLPLRSLVHLPYLWELRPYLRQVGGLLSIGSIAAIIMNTAIVLPALMLGRAIDAVLAIERGDGDATTAGWAALSLVGAAAVVEGSRVFKRYWLITANQRIRANLRADALRGVLAWPAERLHQTPVGDLMARIDGDVETLGLGVREATTEIWDTVLFSLSLIVAMLTFDVGLTLLAMLPVPAAMLLALATGRWVRERISAARAAAARATAALQELLAGVRVLRLFGHEATAIGRYATLSDEQAETMLATQRLRSTLAPTYTVMMVAGRDLHPLARRRERDRRADDGGPACGVPGAVPPVRQARVPGTAAHQLGAGRRRGVPAPQAAARAGAPGRGGAAARLVPTRVRGRA